MALLVTFALGLIVLVAVTGTATGRAMTPPRTESPVMKDLIRECIPNYADVSN